MASRPRVDAGKCGNNRWRGLKPGFVWERGFGPADAVPLLQDSDGACLAGIAGAMVLSPVPRQTILLAGGVGLYPGAELNVFNTSPWAALASPSPGLDVASLAKRILSGNGRKRGKGKNKSKSDTGTAGWRRFATWRVSRFAAVFPQRFSAELESRNSSPGPSGGCLPGAAFCGRLNPQNPCLVYFAEMLLFPGSCV